MTTPIQTECVIVGAGPVGLFLANALVSTFGLHAVRVVVFERRAAVATAAEVSGIMVMYY